LARCPIPWWHLVCVEKVHGDSNAVTDIGT
jgi:hypothetical protein